MNILNSKTKNPSQTFVPIQEIRDGIIILKDGSLRAVLMTSTLNFELKSYEEQTALILQYQNFLNSLDFSIQFFIQSRTLNIEPYLESLRQREKEETNELLKIQLQEYIDFIKSFVVSSNIVNKTFYIVVPYTPSIIEKGQNPFSILINSFLKKSSSKPKTMPQEKFEEYKNQLLQRVTTVVQGLNQLSIRSALLNTEELIELFHGLYNPSEKEGLAFKI